MAEPGAPRWADDDLNMTLSHKAHDALTYIATSQSCHEPAQHSYTLHSQQNGLSVRAETAALFRNTTHLGIR